MIALPPPESDTAGAVVLHASDVPQCLGDTAGPPGGRRPRPGRRGRLTPLPTHARRCARRNTVGAAVARLASQPAGRYVTGTPTKAGHAMPGGKEMMQQLQGALGKFEEAIKRREHANLLDSKVTMQQEVDHARERVVEVVVDLVRGARQGAAARK